MASASPRTWSAPKLSASLSVFVSLRISDNNINGVAVSPACQGSRFLYFSPLTSLKLFRVKTAALNDEEEDISSSVEELGSKPSQSDGLAMDNRGNLYIPVLVLYSWS